MSTDSAPRPVVGGVQIEAPEAIDLGILIAIPNADRVLWSIGGHFGVTMVVGGTAGEMITLAHRLLDMLAELDGVTL
jgi:hypothetical protein